MGTHRALLLRVRSARFGGLLSVAILATASHAHAKKRAQDASAANTATPTPAAAGATAPAPPTASSLYLRALDERGEGKTATARRTLGEALGVVMHDRSAAARGVEKKIRGELAQLDSLLSRVTISSAAASSENVRVELDGDRDVCKQLPCELLLDQGVKKIVASEPGKKPYEATLAIASGTTELKLPVLAPADPPPPAPTPQEHDKVVEADANVHTNWTLGMAPAAIFRTGAYSGGTAVVDVLHLEWHHFEWLSPYASIGLAYNSPQEGKGAMALANPMFGIASRWKIGEHFDLGATAFTAVPVGAGAYNTTLAAAAQQSSTIAGRMFDIDYLTAGGGVDFAWTPNAFSITTRTRFAYEMRLKGEPVDLAKQVLNTTLEFAYHPVGIGLAGGDLTVFIDPRLQVWLSTPDEVVKDPSARDQFMLGGGARWNARMGKASRFASTLGFYHAMDAPLSRTGYNQLEADLSVSW